MLILIRIVDSSTYYSEMVNLTTTNEVFSLWTMQTTNTFPETTEEIMKTLLSTPMSPKTSAELMTTLLATLMSQSTFSTSTLSETIRTTSSAEEKFTTEITIDIPNTSTKRTIKSTTDLPQTIAKLTSTDKMTTLTEEIVSSNTNLQKRLKTHRPQMK